MATRIGQCLGADPGVNTTTTGFTATFSASVIAGHTVVLAICASSAISNAPFQDSAGNTYTLVATGTASSGFQTWFYASKNVSAITGSTTTISPAWSVAANAIMWGDDFATTDGTLDTTAVNANNAATSVTVGPTGSIAQATEIVVAAFAGYIGGQTPPSFTAGTGYTAGGSRTNVIAANADCMYGYFEYALLTSGSGTQTATATLGAAPVCGSAAMATFKDPVLDPFPVAYHQEFPASRAGHAAALRMHHPEPRDRGLPQPRHRRASGLYSLNRLADYLPGKSGLVLAV